MMNKGVIAIDFDGVIADTLSSKAKWLYDKVGVLEPSYKLCKTFFLMHYSESLYAAMQTHFGYEDTMLALPVEESFLGVKELSNNFKIIVMTARCNDKFYWAKEWLKANGFFPFIDELISSYEKSKLEISLNRNYVCLIDNDPRHFKSTGVSEIKQILYLQCATNEKKNTYYETACSWPEILKLI